MRLIRRWLGWHRDEFIDPRRVNDEIRLERRRELDEDPEYRARVKRRMREGMACPLPPLYDRGKGHAVIPFFIGRWSA